MGRPEGEIIPLSGIPPEIKIIKNYVRLYLYCLRCNGTAATLSAANQYVSHIAEIHMKTFHSPNGDRNRAAVKS